MGLFSPGRTILIGGAVFEIVTTEGRDTSTIVTCGGEVIQIERFSRPEPLIAMPFSEHRNDRAYLKRKKGRS